MNRACSHHQLLGLSVFLAFNEVLLLDLVHHDIELRWLSEASCLVFALFSVLLCLESLSISLPLEWFDFKVFLVLVFVGDWWFGEQTIVFPRGSGVNREWIHYRVVKACRNIFNWDGVGLSSVWLAILLRNTAGTHEVERSWSWHSVSTTEAVRSTCSWKGEVPVAEWWNMWHVVWTGCCFALVVAFVKQGVWLSWFAACWLVLGILWSLDGGAVLSHLLFSL